MQLSDIASLLNIKTHQPPIEVHSIETDTRTLKQGALFVALTGDRFNGHDFIQEAEQKGAVCILAQQAVSSTLPILKVDDTLEALTQLAKAYRKQFTLPVIGLTGSCGKTTTKALLAKIFEQSAPTLATEGTLNNHIGVPLMLTRLRTAHQFAVIEMGANHPGEIAHLTNLVRPTTALITNIAPVHLEGFGDLAGVAQSKAEIFQGLDEQGIAVVNADEPYADAWRALNKGKTLLEFGLQGKADITATNIALRDDSTTSFQLVTPQSEIPIHLKLTGEHQVMNALAAAACAYANEIPLLQIKAGLESLESVNRRLCRYQTDTGMQIIDDSYNANPASTLSALKVLQKAKPQRIFVFANMLELGKAEQYYHENIGKAAKEMGIEKLYAYGDLAKFTANAFGENAFHFNDRSALISALKNMVDPQTTLLVKGSNGMRMWEVVEALMKP